MYIPKAFKRKSTRKLSNINAIRQAITQVKEDLKTLNMKHLLREYGKLIKIRQSPTFPLMSRNVPNATGIDGQGFTKLIA